MVTLKYKQFSDWLTQNVSNWRMVYQFMMCDLCMQLAWDSVFANNTVCHVTSNLCLYLTNYYIFVCTVTLWLLTVCLTVVNANISLNMSYTCLDIFGQISSIPMTYFCRLAHNGMLRLVIQKLKLMGTLVLLMLFWWKQM